MNANGSAATRANRFLGAYAHASPSSSPDDDELNEDEIFFTEVSSPVHRQLHSPPSPVAARTLGFSPNREAFGILAALPDPPPRPNSHFFQKSATASSSSSSVASSTSSSSSRLIPRPPQERVPPAASSFSRLHPQSAPVNVPAMMARGRGSDFDDVDDNEKEEEDVAAMTMLPPHEVVARAHTPAVACSVLEGVGRTLKGRDLRKVRNAVWHRTGFLD